MIANAVHSAGTKLISHASGFGGNEPKSRSLYCITHVFTVYSTTITALQLMRGHAGKSAHASIGQSAFPVQPACAVPAILAGGSGYALYCSSQPAVAFSQEGGPSAPQPVAKGPLAAAGAGVPDAIAGALKRFGLKHPTRPVGVAKIDLASSFTDASSPANAFSGATSKPTAAAGQPCHNLCTIKCYMPLQEKQVLTTVPHYGV